MESFDLLVQRRDKTPYVEVKGTTGDGGSDQLTRLEVEFARAHRDDMALLVIARIAINEEAGKPRASGGELRVPRPWSPTDASLQPIAYICRLEDDT